jgi:hypothetical protein
MNSKIIKCAMQVMNYSSIGLNERFDKPAFDKNYFLKNLIVSSPKMVELLKNIKRLDESDYKKYGKLFKHYIYSGVGGGYGSKIIASAFVSSGYQLVNVKRRSKITVSQEIINTKNESKFALLSSTALWNTPSSPSTTKEILEIFNQRPENIHGDKIRFIILDSGFKEGIDLYDVKYCHIFEDQINESDTTQAIGRALRFRGQCGLNFVKNEGWELKVFVYISVIIKENFFKNTEINILDYLKRNDTTLNFRLNFSKELNEITMKNSIDYYLNKNINEYTFKKPFNFFSKVLPVVAGVATLGSVSALSLFAFHKKLFKN